MTLLGDELTKALNEKKNDVNSYIWKGPRVNGVQVEYRLIDANYDSLKKWYDRCQQMLYNKDVRTPGRRTLIKIIDDQILHCRAELLLRWLRKEKSYTNIRCMEDLRTIIANNKEYLTPEVIKTYPISEVMDGLPLDYQDVPIQYVLNSCLDLGGILDTSHITRNFIIKMGLWFTPQELQGELCQKDPDTGQLRNRLDLVREYLKVDPSINLRISETGLSFAEFKSIYMLQKNKYSSYTSEQLHTLADKVLYRLQMQCEDQAKGWDVTR